MIDLQITPTSVAAGVVAQDVAKRVLGPSADLLGQDLGRGYEAVRRNLSRVLRIANEKLGQTAANGGVHRRVARRVFAEARDIDNRFAAEFFGGILASSHGVDADDDSAVPLLKAVESLSTRQIHLHFLTHYLFGKAVFHLTDTNQESYWRRFGIAIDLETVRGIYAVDDFELLVENDIQRLAEAKLLSSEFTLRTPDGVTGRDHRQLRQNGLYVTFCTEGLRLFMRALGQRFGDPSLLPVMEIDYSLSSDLFADMPHPSPARLFKSPYVEQTAFLENEIDCVREESESNVDDLKTQLESAEERIEQLTEKLDRLSSKMDDGDGDTTPS